MHRRTTRRPGRLAPGVVALALVVLTGCAATAPAPPPAPTTSPPSPALAQPAAAVPVSLRLPTIEVEETELPRLGIAGDGSAEVPSDAARVGWFDRGDRSAGPTVLLGHVDSRTGPAVFYRLRELRAGDPVEVGRADGRTERYVVARTEQVAKGRFPTFAVFGATADDVVRLVTCAGTFDRGARSYTDNLVVHAVRA